MEGAFGRKKGGRRPTINLTSLIDVMFLLLIFFMVSSTFRHQFGIDITLPAAESASEQESSKHEIAVDAEGRIYWDAPESDAERPESLEREALTAIFQKTLQDEPDAVIVLRADAAAPFERVLLVIDVARAIGTEQLIIPTQYRKTTPEIQ